MAKNDFREEEEGDVDEKSESPSVLTIEEEKPLVVESVEKPETMGVASFLEAFHRKTDSGLKEMILSAFVHAGVKTAHDWESAVSERLNRRVW